MSSLWVYAQTSQVLPLPFPSESLCVVVCPWYQPWVTSIHREQASLLESGSCLLLRDGQSLLSLLSSPAPVVTIATYGLKFVAECGSRVIPTQDACEIHEAIVAGIHDGRCLQDEVQGDMVLVCQALRALVPGIMDQQPSGCGNPLGRRIIIHMATLLMAPIARRGMITTRGGQASRPPFVRAMTSPIPRGHGLVRGVIRASRTHRGMGRVVIAVVRHVTDCGSSRYGMKGVVMGRECMRDELKIE